MGAKAPMRRPMGIPMAMTKTIASPTRTELRMMAGISQSFWWYSRSPSAIAVGVGSLAGVRGFGRAFRFMLLAEARTLMAADLMVRVFEQPTREQEQLLESLELRGARRTGITETISMLSAGGGNDTPVFCGIKAVETYFALLQNITCSIAHTGLRSCISY